MEYYHDIDMLIKDKLIIENWYLKNSEGGWIFPATHRDKAFISYRHEKLDYLQPVWNNIINLVLKLVFVGKKQSTKFP